MKGPTLPISIEIHTQKYRDEGESFEDSQTRVARTLSDNAPHYNRVLDVLMDQRFLPAGRVQAAVGSPKNVTPYNCYVSGTIEDSFVQGEGSIMQRATEAAQTMRMGGGIGYDFSGLRPRGDLIKALNSHSSGPISFMNIFDSVCKTVSSAGHRRGAQMGVLRVDHPDILDFITAKADGKSLTGFNVSVGITDEFMEALYAGKAYDLRFGGRIYGQLDAEDVWDRIMRNTWDWAEPGVLFIDTINQMNNLWYTEKIAATNPCGEQPLPPYGACLLGSFNLTKYVGDKVFHWDQLAKDIPDVVRAMDNVIDAAIYPLPNQEREAKTKRRMGLGVTGLANTVEYMGHPYGSIGFCAETDHILSFIKEHAYMASIELAMEKGHFQMFDRDFYSAGKFIQTLDQETQNDIKKYGIRNSHLTSIAPTGTISLCADNVSSGIEPVFSYHYDRDIHVIGGKITERVTDYGLRVFGVSGKRADDLTVKEHLDVLIVASQNVDSAVSKTLNVGDNVTFDDFKEIYTTAYDGGCKGCTTFRASGKREGILRKEEDDTGQACAYDPTTGERSCE